MGSTLSPLAGSDEFCDKRFRAESRRGGHQCPLSSQNVLRGHRCWLRGAVLGWTSLPVVSLTLSPLDLQRPRATGMRPCTARSTLWGRSEPPLGHAPWPALGCLSLSYPHLYLLPTARRSSGFDTWKIES